MSRMARLGLIISLSCVGATVGFYTMPLRIGDTDGAGSVLLLPVLLVVNAALGCAAGLVVGVFLPGRRKPRE